MFKLIKIYFLKRLRIQQKYSLVFVIGVLAVIIIFAIYFFSDASISLSRKILINQKLNTFTQIFQQKILNTTALISSHLSQASIGSENLKKIEETLKINDLKIIRLQFVYKFDSNNSTFPEQKKTENISSIDVRGLPPWLVANFYRTIDLQIPQISNAYFLNAAHSSFGDNAKNFYAIDLFFPVSGTSILRVSIDASSLLDGNLLKFDGQRSGSIGFLLSSDDEVVISQAGLEYEPGMVYPVTTSSSIQLLGTSFTLTAFANAHYFENYGVLVIYLYSLFLLVLLLTSILLFLLYQRSVAAKKLNYHQDLLLSQSKFVSLSEIATVLSHELNQPLASIRLLCSSILDSLKEPNLDAITINKLAKLIDSESLRMDTIIKSVRSFLKNKKSSGEALLLSSLVFELKPIIDLQAQTLNTDVLYDLRHDPSIFCDKVMLEQVILNITRNALDAMKVVDIKKRQISISVNVESYRAYLRISDSGPGIPDNISEKIFQPFFSTKEDGMGFGLSICRSMVEIYQGDIAWENISGSGACFAISFPLVSSKL